MSYLRNIYAKLKCKQCKKTFCCTVCRRKHEEHVHSILEDCDVCQKGNILIGKTKNSETLLRHIQEKHWPLHCVYCYQVYDTTAALIEGNCHCRGFKKMGEKIAGKTPMLTKDSDANEMKEIDFDSPDNRNMNTNIFSSTPMNEQMKSGFKLPENITPVDSDKSQEALLADPGPGHTMSSSVATKSTRKVTFLSTPALENVRRKPKNHENFLKVSLKNSMRLSQNESSTKLLPTNSIGSQASEKSNYVTAADRVSSKAAGWSGEASVQQKSQPTTAKKRRSYSMNETVWLSAINESIALHDITNSPDDKGRLSVTLSTVDLARSPQPPPADSHPAYADPQCIPSSKKAGVWSSMTSLLRNVVQGFGASQPSTEGASNKSTKRHQSQMDHEGCDEADGGAIKKMKLCDIKCRRPIRVDARIVPKMDKSIQTDADDYYADN